MDFGHLMLATEQQRARRGRTILNRRQLRDANDPFSLCDGQFVCLYRISKEIAFTLIQGVEPCLKRVRANGLPTHIIVLTAVRFFAVGSYQRCIGQEVNLSLGQRTVSKVVKEVSNAIVQRLFPSYIKFPSTAVERRTVAEGFQQKHGIPACLGCIDCTHIAIVTPYNNDPEDPPTGYRNRKGNYSINTQFICDSNCKLLNVNAKFPGSTHDSHIFNQSLIKQEMMRLTSRRIGQYFFIGDSGYPKEVYMLTPILPTPAEGSPESAYNKKLARVRNCVERTNGIIKAIFRCLHKDRVLHYQPQAAAMIILSCCTIYNMMHHYRFPLLEPEDIVDESQQNFTNFEAHSVRNAALHRQQQLINFINN